MTNILTAALISTNVLLGGAYVDASDVVMTNDLSRFWSSAMAVENRCVTEREIRCPVCQNVTTQQVDVTDIYSHYQQLRSIDLRCNQDLVRMCLSTARQGSEEAEAIKAELKAAKAAIVEKGTDLAMACYWDGYTNALLKTASSLRGTGDEMFIRLFAPGERKLLRKLAESLEEAAARTSKEVR